MILGAFEKRIAKAQFQCRRLNFASVRGTVVLLTSHAGGR